MTQTSRPEAVNTTPAQGRGSDTIPEPNREEYSSEKHACLCAPNLSDEALISEISRYHVTSANRTTTETYRELFNCPPFSLNTSIPPHIAILASKIEGDIADNIQQLLDRKTLFPLFQLFSGMSFEHFRLQAKQNHQPSGDGPQRRHRVQRDPIPAPKRILEEPTRLCLHCVHEDFETFGLPYIHLSHQVPGVTVCAKHAAELIYKCPYCECPFNRPKELVLRLWGECRCHKYLTDFVPSNKKTGDAIALSYARFTADILAADVGSLQPIMLIACYKKRAHDLGYDRGTKIHRVRLFEEIEKYYGAKFLSEIDSAYKKGRLTGWFNLINERYVTEVPLSRHLLVAHFLFKDAKLFTQSAKKIRTTLLDGDFIQSKGEATSKHRSKTTPLAKDVNAERAKELMREVLRTAQSTPGCTLETLWRMNYGKMKFLTRLNPDAIVQLKQRLGRLKHRPEPPKRTALAPHPKDGERALKVKEAARLLYSTTTKPCRASQNRLKKDIEWHPGPSEVTRHPATSLAIKEQLESSWHFYARRMVWSILHHQPASSSAIRLASGVEYHRSIELYNFFQTLDSSTPLAEGTIMAILEKYGIDRNWQGPCPDRQFLSAGRAYYEHRDSA